MEPDLVLLGDQGSGLGEDLAHLVHVDRDGVGVELAQQLHYFGLHAAEHPDPDCNK